MLLELKKIYKEYVSNKQVVLDNISISFRENEFVSILGPSGSGKTTLLNIIGGLDNYTSGDLIINKVSTRKYNDKDWDIYRNHKVGFVFQNYNLIPHQSVLANVELALTLSGVSKNERKKRAIKLLTKVGLKNHINKKPNQLSGGQMQRVAIARALINDPDILLADEPTGALDTKTSKQIMDLLKEVASSKLVIMVTHNPSLAQSYSNRIIKLLDGKIIEDTNPFEMNNEKIIIKKNKKKKMSFITSLSLSLNNLMTKKGRTILTGFAGSIGIIGIAFILSISNGINKYMDKIKKDTISLYPIVIQKNTYDTSSTYNIKIDEKNYNDEKIHVVNVMDDLVIKTKEQNLKSFNNYLDKTNISEYVYDIKKEYDININLYKKDPDKIIKINQLFKQNYNILYELINNDSLLNSQYDLIYGSYPTKYNEVLLEVNNNNQISDYTLYSLDILNQDKPNIDSFFYNELIGLSFSLITDSDYYIKENGIWTNKMNDKEFMRDLINISPEIKIVGIVKSNSSTNEFGRILYTHDLVEYIINKVVESDIVKEQINNKDIDVFTGKDFSSNENISYDNNLKRLGVSYIDDPLSISIYPKDFKSKNEIIKILDNYEKDKITYTDFFGTMMKSISSFLNVISSVLISFVSISLVVSSIMISIITYISVLERKKEIGILRSLGASKKDISRVFNAETFIEGLISGILGIILTIIINIPINLLAYHFFDIKSISMLPIRSSIILIIISVILNVVSGLIPSKLASKKDVVKSLRSE